MRNRWLFLAAAALVALAVWTVSCEESDEDESDDEPVDPDACDRQCATQEIGADYLCRAAKADCMGACPEDDGDCQDECAEVADRCRSAKVDIYVDCIEGCNYCLHDRSVCDAGCETIYDACEADCGGDRDCIEECGRALYSCSEVCIAELEACTGWWDGQCLDGCLSTAADCNEACEDDAADWGARWDCEEGCADDRRLCELGCIDGV